MEYFGYAVDLRSDVVVVKIDGDEYVMDRAVFESGAALAQSAEEFLAAVALAFAPEEEEEAPKKRRMDTPTAGSA